MRTAVTCYGRSMGAKRGNGVGDALGRAEETAKRALKLGLEDVSADGPSGRGGNKEPGRGRTNGSMELAG